MMPLRNPRSAIRGVRVWLAMGLIAVFAVYLGWEIHADDGLRGTA
jgi:uncharacterized membrane protein YccC